MKRLFVVFLASFEITALVLAMSVMSCKEVVAPTVSEGPIHIYNSAWQDVTTSYRVLVAPRDILSTMDNVKAYNAAHTDDQLQVFDKEVPIQLAPMATGYICNTATLEPYFQKTVPREELVTNRDAWRLSVEVMSDPKTGSFIPCTLYVDNIPPEPPVIVPPTPKLYLALIDWTDWVVPYYEKCATQAEAIERYQKGYLPQRDLNIMTDGHNWEVYWGAIAFVMPAKP